MNHELMMPDVRRSATVALACLALSFGSPALSQGNVSTDSDGYGSSSAASPAAGAEPAQNSDGPVRMVRFTLVDGGVTWRADPSLEWSSAAINLPLRQGAQVYVPFQGRAELQFDDGSFVRLGEGAVLTFTNLYSDADGEFTELQLTDGTASLDLKSSLSIYQVDTPFASVKAIGPARVRLGARDATDVGVSSGTATVEGKQGKSVLEAGQFVEIRDDVTPFALTNLPPEDSWEHWVQERDAVFEAGSPESQRYLPPNIQIAAPNLDAYGTWETVPTYGAVWIPRVAAGWRPYDAGRWVWVNPFGWTWVSSEAWGWAPYHYGTWAHIRRGWAWAPGPACQYWSPALVDFCTLNGSVYWTPLCPEEVRYPATLGIRFRQGDWSRSFSIGACGVYYADAGRVYEARPWSTVYLNANVRGRDIRYGQSRHNDGGFGLVAISNQLGIGSWIPRNAGFGGSIMATVLEFGAGGRHSPVMGTTLAALRMARHMAAPEPGRAPTMGLPSLRPNLASLTPGHRFRGESPQAGLFDRAVFSSPVRAQVARNMPVYTSRTSARFEQPASHQADRGVARFEPQGANRAGTGVNSREAAQRWAVARREPGFGPSRAPIENRTIDSVRAARSSLGFGGGSVPGFREAATPGWTAAGGNPGFGRSSAQREERTPDSVRAARYSLGFGAGGRQSSVGSDTNRWRTSSTPRTGNSAGWESATRARETFAARDSSGRTARQWSRSTSMPSPRGFYEANGPSPGYSAGTETHGSAAARTRGSRDSGPGNFPDRATGPTFEGSSRAASAASSAWNAGGRERQPGYRGTTSDRARPYSDRTNRQRSTSGASQRWNGSSNAPQSRGADSVAR